MESLFHHESGMIRTMIKMHQDLLVVYMNNNNVYVYDTFPYIDKPSSLFDKMISFCDEMQLQKPQSLTVKPHKCLYQYILKLSICRCIHNIKGI